MSTQKFGRKVSWSADTPIKIAIKRRLYLVGIGLVCGTEGAPTEYFNAGDFNSLTPSFTDQPTAAYGNLVEGELPDDPWAGRRWGEDVKGIKGDVNSDGQVGIGDIICVSNFMAGVPNGVTLQQADVNGDGQVGIGDIISITNIMAGAE